MIVLEFLKIMWQTIVTVLRAFLSLIPTYQKLSNLQTEILAAIFGVSFAVMSTIITTISVFKFIRKHS